MKNKLIILSVFTSIFFSSWSSSEQLPLAANYIYKITTDPDRKAYIFGSTSSSESHVPINLGDCSKKILISSDIVYMQNDQLGMRKMLTTVDTIVQMSVVAGAMKQSQINRLSQIIFGSDSSKDIIQLLETDATSILNNLNERIPGRAAAFYVSDYSLDTKIEFSARFIDKPVRFLESPEEQLDFLRKIPPESFASEIDEAITSLDDKVAAAKYLEKQILELQAAATGDEVTLAAATKESENNLEKEFNVHLASKINNLIRNSHKSIFIALDASHMAGEFGLIQQLRGSGLKIKRLCQ